MKKKNGFTLRDVCGEKVIIGEGLEAINFQKIITLNESAALLWSESKTEFTVEELADILCSEYDVSREKALQDAEKTAKGWIEMGIAEA